jgi:hypothetical protein
MLLGSQSNWCDVRPAPSLPPFLVFFSNLALAATVQYCFVTLGVGVELL